MVYVVSFDNSEYGELECCSIYSLHVYVPISFFPRQHLAIWQLEKDKGKSKTAVSNKLGKVQCNVLNITSSEFLVLTRA